MADNAPSHPKETRPDRFILAVGRTTAWLIALLMVLILVQVVLRYLFNKSYIALEELQWHLYAVIIMLGMSYAYVKDSHIRLDILHSRFSRRRKEWIELLGILFLLWPMVAVFFLHSLPFVAESFRVGERSDAPMGLGCRWAIKAVIPVAFGLLFLGSVSRLAKAAAYLIRNKKGDAHGS